VYPFPFVVLPFVLKLRVPCDFVPLRADAASGETGIGCAVPTKGVVLKHGFFLQVAGEVIAVKTA
jgi:hypothetical protein